LFALTFGEFDVEPDRRSSQRYVTIRDNVVQSSQLLCKEGPLRILHAGEQYQLRITRQGKLILTK
jgi:hemin uptake protein HemP|tara:strand:- start:115 stop:309 length:195 start_codon:yes stop_codon:yes gene_type:complete